MGDLADMAKRYRLKQKKSISHQIKNRSGLIKINKTLNKPDGVMQNSIINTKIEECYNNYCQRIVVISSTKIAHKCHMPLNEAQEVGREIASEVFAVLCEKYSSINEQYIYSWLYKVTENLTNNFIRKFFDEMRHMNVSLDDESRSEIVRNLSIVPDEYDVEVVKERFLESLTPEERKEYELYFCTDKNLKEIAEELNMEHAAVRKHKSRFLAKLKKKLLTLLYVF